MEQWYRKNKVFIPWAFLGLQLATSVVWRIYKSRSGAGKDDEIVPSPLETLLPKISDAEAASLAYPPNAYPGARDVKSPYGSLRVYEFGPEDGRKVLLVHGMSTPCIALGAIAHGLADKRCRVMLFDLPGRGYSSTPVSTPQSTRLFTTCILLSLTSSSLPWTGSGTRFSLIGYSLGGGIVANFTSYFPSLVSSLILLAPSGLVRPERTSLTNKLLYSSGLINETFLEWIIRRRMSHGETPGKRRAAKVVGVAAPATEEAPDDIPGSRLGLPELSRARPGITIPELVAWQLSNHPGFIKAFISGYRHGPIMHQSADWRRIGQRLSADETLSVDQGLQNGMVLIIGGEKDVLVVKDELAEDATEALGADNVLMEFVDAGHEFPITKSEEIVQIIWKFWQNE